MFFIFLIFLAALSIESIGTYISVLGLGKTFHGDPVILSMAVVLDFVKIILVSLLYKKKDTIPKIWKMILYPATGVMMLITSYGISGYMSESFQKAMAPNSEIKTTLTSDVRERAKLEARKKEIDTQIASLPSNYITGRQRLMKSFGPEIDHINSRLIELDKEILKLKTTNIESDTNLGPIVFISKAFNISLETAVTIIIMMIVFVFDPIAVMLILSGNFLIEERNREESEQKKTMNRLVNTPIKLGVSPRGTGEPREPPEFIQEYVDDHVDDELEQTYEYEALAEVVPEHTSDDEEVSIDIGKVAQLHPEIIRDEIDNEILEDLRALKEYQDYQNYLKATSNEDEAQVEIRDEINIEPAEPEPEPEIEDEYAALDEPEPIIQDEESLASLVEIQLDKVTDPIPESEPELKPEQETDEVAEYVPLSGLNDPRLNHVKADVEFNNKINDAKTKYNDHYISSGVSVGPKN